MATPVAARAGSAAAITVPGAPTGVKAIPGYASAVVSWTAPASDGGSAITGYAVTTSPGTKGCTTKGARRETCRVMGLRNGITYSASVRARNLKGLGATSAHVSVKPGEPSAPTDVKTIGGIREVTVSWTAPADNGSVITRFTVRSSPGSKTCSTTRATACTVTGLTDDTTYTFKVTATNALGTGPASAASPPITPPVVRTIGVPSTPVGISSDGTHVWVVNPDGNSVTELSASSGSVTETIPVGHFPFAVSSDGTHVWVANDGSNTVTELNASNGTLVQTIPVGVEPDAISSDGTHVWVANYGGLGNPSTVTEIDASTGSVVQTIGAGESAGGISSDGTDVWVALGEGTGPNVEEIDASTGSVVRTISAGEGADSISSDGTHVWVLTVGGSVTELNASDGSFVQAIPVAGRGLGGIFSNGTHVWVATGDGTSTVTELSTADGSLVQTVPVGGNPSAVSSDATHVWVANEGSASVTEIVA
jgi:YVTN family beta-propeller protein